jgi:hypothetical protein
MAETPGLIRSIAWRELFPWLILLRCFRIAISPTLLGVATVAVLLTSLGWRISGLVFLSAEEQIAQATRPQLADLIPKEIQGYFPPSIRIPLFTSYFQFSEPLARFFQLQSTLGEAAFYAFGFLWTLAVWAFPGGMITRRAVVQLATDAAPGLQPTAVFACRRWLWYFLAPLYPLLGIVLLTIPIALVGLLLNISTGFGVAIAGIGWLLVALAGIGAMWLFGGLIFGWPLAWPAISAERDGDPIDAFSRSYAYVYGKPLHYFFYVVLAAALGALCWAVVWTAAVLVQEFGFWALSWGGGGPTVASIREKALDIADGEFAWREEGALWKLGATLIGLVLALIHAVTGAFRFTFFFTAASAIYLLLRQDVDEKETDEVFIEASTEPRPSPAPPVASAVTETRPPNTE